MADEKKPVKKKGKPRGGNSPMIGNNGLNLEEGDNTKYLAVSIKLMNMSKVDLYKPEDVAERLTEYFQLHADNDMKPTVMGMAMALGLDRRRLWEIRTGAAKGGSTEYDLPTLTLDYIKNAYKTMENLWENYMQNNKINVVAGIFLGKNNFGYQDKTEYVVTPNTNSDSAPDVDDIRKRYVIDSPERLSIDSATIDSEE